MTDCLLEEINSGKDECFTKVIDYLEQKSACYFQKLSDAFGSVESFHEFQKYYDCSAFPESSDQVACPLHDHFCAILEWRALLATEVETLRLMREEIEDYPKDFEIQIRLSEALHEQNRLHRELERFTEQNERLQMENNAYNAIVDEVKKDFNEKLADANERAKKAEKAFIDLTRRRTTVTISDFTNPATKAVKLSNPAVQKSNSGVVVKALSSVAMPYKSSLDKVRNSSMRFKEYSTLTAWEGFDSLDEDSGDENEVKVVNSIHRLEPQLSSSPTPVPEAHPPLDCGISRLPSFDASPIKSSRHSDSPKQTNQNCIEGVSVSLSSTPRKSSPSLPITPRQTDTSPPESAVVAPGFPPVGNPAMRCSRILLEAENSGVVDKAAYLQLYDEVLELRCELEKARTKIVSQTAVSTTNAKDLGLTTQLSDLRDQMCEPSARDTSFASPARVVGGNVPNPIPLSENKHLTDWSISLDQTNTSCCQIEPNKGQYLAEMDEKGAHKPRASMSVGQQTEVPFYCLNCSTDTVVTQSGLVPLLETNPSAIGVNMLSSASTLQELNVDFSESTTRPGLPLEYTDSVCSPTTEKLDNSSEFHLIVNPLREQNHRLLNSLIDASSACQALQKRLSSVGCGAPYQMDCNAQAIHAENSMDLAAILQQLDSEVDRISANFVELKARLESKPCYEVEIIKLREKLEEAERLLEGRLSGDPQIVTATMSEVLEAEREQLQRELNQRLADCSSTHATSVAELEHLQTDLCARLSASELRSNNLEIERDAVVQKLNVTERFLNEQLQERDQEREEFQSEVSVLQNEIVALRNKLISLERQQSQESSSASSSVAHTPVGSPRKAIFRQGKVQTIATSTPSVHQRRPCAFTPSLRSVPDSSDHSDVDDSPTFELSSTPHCIMDRPSDLSTHNRRDGTRPYSAGDAISRKQTQPPVRLSTTCVGNSPVELVNASISVQTSLSSSSSSTTIEFDAEDDDLVSTEDEIDDVQTKTTTSAALGVLTTTVTTTTKKRRNRSSRPCASNTSEEANNIGLDVEMRHVAEMKKLREALEQAQSALIKKDFELKSLGDHLDSTSQSPIFSQQNQFHSPFHTKMNESVHVQTLSNEAIDGHGACWSCGRVSVSCTIASVQTSDMSPHGSRQSTLSPPPVVERSVASSASFNAGISVSTSGRTSSLAGDIESQLADEEELCEPREQNISTSEGDRLVADLEEARAEIEALKTENNGLISYQDDLHKDFELVQSMLEGRQSEVEHLQKELLEVPIRLQADFDATVRDLRKIISDRYNVVEERDEDLFLLTEEKEVLTNRVGELEKEVADLRDGISSGRNAVISREDTGSQTDPPHWTVESGIQVDLESSSPTSKTQSLADTDCVSEEDLPFDGDFLMSSQTVAVSSAEPLTVDEALAIVDRQQQECCRLLSLSLAASNCQASDPNDYKSQLISRLIEANRTLKSVVESITKEDQALQSSQTETPMTHESITYAMKSRNISNQLYSSLLSALLADRKANLAFTIWTTINQTSNALSGRVPSRPRSCEPKAASKYNVRDILKALDSYANAEEERWSAFSASLAGDRENLLLTVDSLKKSEDLLFNEVGDLTNQLAAKDAILAEKSCILKDLSAELKVSKATIADLTTEATGAKSDFQNQLALSRRQVEEERQRVTELESTLQASQHALSQTRVKVASLEGDLEKATANLNLERNRLHLVEDQLVQFERGSRILRPPYARIGPKLNVNGNIHAPSSSLKGKDPSVVNNAINHLASVRLRAIQAEKMSRELHACSQDLRVSVAEAELSLLPMCLCKENGGGIGSDNTSGDDESPLSGEMILRSLPKQLTDSGFADAPTGLRRLHLACSRLIHLASIAVSDRSAPSPVASCSSSDSLNNPAELLRHAVLGGKKADLSDQSNVSEVYACLAEIESHVRSLIGGPVVKSHVTSTSSTATAQVIFAHAKQLILSGVNHLDSNLAQISAPLDDDLISHRPSESRSSQCSLVNEHQSCGDSHTVSLDKFRHMSARYLRMESYRRALVYQKQYLLLLLGDFQHSVQRVTASLGQGLLMGASSRLNTEGASSSSQNWPLNTPPALVRFRAAARCITVIHRVKQLRLKWQRTGIRNHAQIMHNHLTDSRTPGSSFSVLGSHPPTPLTVPNLQNDALLEQRSSAVSLTSCPFDKSHSGLIDSRSGMSRRNHSTSSIAQPTCAAYPRGEQPDASSSFRQHYHVPTSSASKGRFHWGPFRG